MDQVGVNGAKHEEKWGPESVLKHETSTGDIIARYHGLATSAVQKHVCMQFAELAHVSWNEHKLNGDTTSCPCHGLQHQWRDASSSQRACAVYAGSHLRRERLVCLGPGIVVTNIRMYT